MQKVEAATLASIDDYRLVDADTPAPGPGEVLVQIAACGVGYVDALVGTGLRKVEDARERYHFEVSSPADAALIVSALYLPTTSARRREAAINWLVGRTAKVGPARISIAMRRFVVLKQPTATRDADA